MRRGLAGIAAAAVGGKLGAGLALATLVSFERDFSLAVHAGIPAVSLVSLRDGFFTNYHLPTDTPDRVDWESVSGCTRLAAAVAEEWTGP